MTHMYIFGHPRCLVSDIINEFGHPRAMKTFKNRSDFFLAFESGGMRHMSDVSDKSINEMCEMSKISEISKMCEMSEIKGMCEMSRMCEIREMREISLGASSDVLKQWGSVYLWALFPWYLLDTPPLWDKTDSSYMRQDWFKLHATRQIQAICDTTDSSYMRQDRFKLYAYCM